MGLCNLGNCNWPTGPAGAITASRHHACKRNLATQEISDCCGTLCKKPKSLLQATAVPDIDGSTFEQASYHTCCCCCSLLGCRYILKMRCCLQCRPTFTPSWCCSSMTCQRTLPFPRRSRRGSGTPHSLPLPVIFLQDSCTCITHHQTWRACSRAAAGGEVDTVPPGIPH